MDQRQQKKCRGNRRDQRFRRKCRAQHMQPEKIEKLIKKRYRIQKKHPIEHTTNMNTESTGANLNKRKRDISLQHLSTATETMTRSQSPLSVQQSTLKRMKKASNTMSDSMVNRNDIGHSNINYQRPMYLIRSSSLLWQQLNKSLNYSLKEKNEQRFIYERLELLDRQYCLETDQHFWQSYFDIGSQKLEWTSKLYTMTKTNDFEKSKEYLMNYLQNINHRLTQCQMALTKHSQSYPIEKLPFEQVELHLREFVDQERRYLSTRNNEQLNKFKDEIYTKDLVKTISTYFSQNHTQIHNCVDRLLTIREKQAEIWKEQLMLEIRILCKFLPVNFNDLETFIAPIHYLPLNDDRKVIEVKNKRYKTIQEAKRMWLNLTFHAYEIRIKEYEIQYQMEFQKLETQLSNNTTIVNEFSPFDHIKEYINCRTNRFIKDISVKIESYRRIILQNRQRSSSTKMTIGVSPEPYLDLITNPFDVCTWNHLSLGPAYIRLNQSAIRPQSQQESEIKREHKDIYGKVQKHLTERPHLIPRTIPLFPQYSHQLNEHLYQSYGKALSYKNQLITLEQAQNVTLIRKIIKNMNLIIRVTDKGGNFYIGSSSTFEKKVNKFFSDTNAFVELSSNPFHQVLEDVIQLLNTLQSKKLILQWQWKKMLPDREKAELPHLYFNPKTHKADIPVRPIENTMRAPTRNISKFLDEILRPIFNEKCKTTTIIDGAQLVGDLSNYTRKGLLKPTTLFCTFDIHNLYTMLPQDDALNILMQFLFQHDYRKVKTISLDTIKKLASKVLKDNVFVYGKKIYKQTTGGAMGSSFTLTLANIFMWHWQKKFVEEQASSGEYFGRYIDDIFMTWNKSEEELKNFLDHANTWHPNIKFDYKIGKSLPFLDVQLTNNNGILTTSVYHKPAAEPYVLPFISDHPRHVFTNVIKTALARAVRYSSTFDAFDTERRTIKLTLLYNGYPSTFIDNEFRKFFFEYLSTSPFLPFIDNEKQFFAIRTQLLSEPTARQSQIATSAATADLNNEQIDEETMPSHTAMTTTATTLDKKVATHNHRFILHHTYEQRFNTLKKEMHRVYEKNFQNTPAFCEEMMVGTRNRRDTKNELIRKRPKGTLLRNTITKRQQKKQSKIVQYRQTARQSKITSLQNIINKQ